MNEERDAVAQQEATLAQALQFVKDAQGCLLLAQSQQILLESEGLTSRNIADLEKAGQLLSAVLVLIDNTGFDIGRIDQ